MLGREEECIRILDGRTEGNWLLGKHVCRMIIFNLISFVYSSHGSIHWYRNRHIIKAIYIIYNIQTSSVNIHKTPVKMVTQSLWVNNIILYFSVRKSTPGQEPFRYRICQIKNKYVYNTLIKAHTFMMNHTGQQKHPYKLHRQCYTEAKAEGNCT
jgi:hypothetical protein